MANRKKEAGKLPRKIHGRKKKWRQAKNLGNFMAERKSGSRQKTEENLRLKKKGKQAKKVKSGY